MDENEECKENILDEENPAEKEAAEYKDKYIRLLAELENTRKRLIKEKNESVRFAVENVIAEFLPTIDSFENALGFADKMSSEVKSWAAGFQMFLTQFKDTLHNHGIVAFHSEGNQFDPHYHEAVETVETNNFAEGTILKEFSKGYKSAVRTIRAARVQVAKKCEADIEDEEKIYQEENKI